MYGIIGCGGKQYRVSPGDKILVNKLSDAKVGDEIVLNSVYFHQSEMGQSSIGSPLLAGASFRARVERSFKDKKVIVFKKKRRKNYRVKKGHRQDLMELSIVSIDL